MKKILVSLIFIFTTAVGFSQTYDDVYYQPSKDTTPTKEAQSTIDYYDFNNNDISYSTRIYMFNYPWYYNYNSYFYTPYYYNWDFYTPYYYNWDFYYPNFWHTPYYYGWNYQHRYGALNYQHKYNGWNYQHRYNTYYGPRKSYNGSTNTPPKNTNRNTSPKYNSPKYQKPEYNRPTRKTYTQPKQYNSYEYYRIRTNPKEYKAPKYDDRTPKYWKNFNDVSKPTPRVKDYNYNKQRSPNSYSAPRSTPTPQRNSSPTQKNTRGKR